MPTTPTGWMSYDSVADTYERVAVPWFAALADDLIEAAQLRSGERVLDVGTGTGLAARAARNSEAALWIVGVDPSSAMLSKVPTGTLSAGVGAIAPGLPFAAASFDAVVANLALSHFADHAGGVRDIARVLRPGGRFACTAWRAAEPDGAGNVRAEADQIVADVRAAHGLDLTPPDNAVPWEQWLKEPDNVRALLGGAGLNPVDIATHRSSWPFAIDEFLSGWGANSRYIRHAAGADRWRSFVDDAAAELHKRFGDRIEIISVAWIAVGHKAPARRTHRHG